MAGIRFHCSGFPTKALHSSRHIRGLVNYLKMKAFSMSLEKNLVNTRNYIRRERGALTWWIGIGAHM